jgi:2-oxoglutarate dehydrogenase E2 component (dihydrolipoamide succinyltransferase)
MWKDLRMRERARRSMSTEIHVPELGESITEATIGKWLKEEGDQVKAGEALVELETDKVNFEVEAEQDGVLESIAAGEGEDIGVGAVLGTISEGDGTPSEDSEPSEPEAEAGEQTESEEQQAEQTQEAEGDAEAQEGKAEQDASEEADGRQQDHDGDQTQAPASPQWQPEEGAERDDQQKQVEQPQEASGAEDGKEALEERVRLSRLRQTIAQRLVEAQQTTAMLTTFNEVDMGAIIELRNRRKEAFQERHEVKLGFMSFFTKASIGALKAFPKINAELQDTELVYKNYYNVGVAVNTEQGLVVPVVRDADKKSFADIERDIMELGQKAQEGKLGVEEMQGGTFTITNGGIFGSLNSTPILNIPQVAILGMHKTQERPVAVDGQVEIRPMMYLALSYDHRIVDGADAVQFLVRVKELIEDPESLLLEG